MANPNLDSFISQLGTKALVGLVVAGVIGIAVYALRTWFEGWIDRKVRRWKSKREAKRYKNMSDDDVLDAPKCPTCIGSMILRTARKGANRGENFWGCGAFPKCRGARKACSS